MKNLLMICYAFPVLGGSGVQRPAKFAKCFPQFGWEPRSAQGTDLRFFGT